MTLLGAYRAARRIQAKGFSLAISGSFAEFGQRTVIEPPARIAGESHIAMGCDVFVGAGSWLAVQPGATPGVHLRIGDRTSIAGSCVLSAATSIELGQGVLLARNVYIADHRHSFTHVRVPIRDQGIEQIEPVSIGDGAWLGQNVVVLPGVQIGAGAVVAANSVVRNDVPAFSLAVGAPARVVRTWLSPETP